MFFHISVYTVIPVIHVLTCNQGDRIGSWQKKSEKYHLPTILMSTLSPQKPCGRFYTFLTSSPPPLLRPTPPATPSYAATSTGAGDNSPFWLRVCTCPWASSNAKTEFQPPVPLLSILEANPQQQRPAHGHPGLPRGKSLTETKDLCASWWGFTPASCQMRECQRDKSDLWAVKKLFQVF